MLHSHCIGGNTVGAWLIGPAYPACCGTLRVWTWPIVQAFAATLAATMAAWVVLWLLLPSYDLFQPLCRLGVFLTGATS